MKNVFLCLINKGRSAVKYFIFSTLFVLLGILGVSKVEAANTDFAYNNDKIENECVANNLDNSYLSYIISSSNYDGNGVQPCVSYSYPKNSPTTKYFYLQATDDRTGNPNTTKLQTIQFKIKKTDVSPTGDFKYIAVFEEEYTLSGGILYDLYTQTATDTFSYQLITESGAAATAQDTYYEAGNNNKGNISVSGDYYVFSYALRNPSYGANSISVHFYNPVHSTSNPTRRTVINFYLARPIKDFASELVTSAASCTGATTSGTFASGKICLIYSNSASLTMGTNTIQVIIPNNAAFYFSTYLAQGKALASLNKDNIVDNLKYNSIYAVNTFNNTDGSEVRYYYHNVADNTAYIKDASNADATNSKINTSDKYNMQLTMDARGSYQFFITDVFNTKNETTAKVQVNDKSNREIDIWFVDSLSVYEAFKNNGAGTVSADFFKILAAETNLTNKNIQIIIELYYTILIDEQYGIWDKTSNAIKSNPLEGNELNRASSSYCRSITDGDGYSSCYSGSSATQFNKHTINSTQTINATYNGLNDTTLFPETEADQYGSISNEFALAQGTIADISLNGKLNRTHAWVNENGRFVFEIFDTFGNSRIAWIDVSVIDQLQPTIDSTQSGETTESIDRQMCTSTYVYGGYSAFAAPIYGATGYDSDCAARSVEYDASAETSQSGDTGKDADADRFLLNSTTNAKIIYYNTNGAREFSYTDAIRIARLIAYDSITNSANTTIAHRSTYQNTSSATFENYGLTSENVATNATIMSGLYLQYSSKLASYDDQLQVRIFIDHLNAYVAFTDGTNICNSNTNEDTCYSIVNNFIDRGIDFTIVFNAKDVVGNVSNDFTVKVEVIDDTAPGLATIDAATGAITNATPDIQTTNLDTVCRLEIGNKIQSKNQLLKCYGLVEGNWNADYSSVDISGYNFVDNKSGLQGSAGSVSFINYSDTNFGNVLSYQWYAKHSAYDKNIKVQINLNNTWTDVTETRNIQIDNAGYYKLKFVITDNTLNSGSADSNYNYNNSTTLVVWYYVNPKVLLIAPEAQSVEYGTAATTLKYDVYTSANDEAFYTNPFSVSAADLPNFLRNYTKADTTTNAYLSLSGRKMAGTLQVVDKKLHDAAGGAILTNNGKEINDAAVINAGSYYITMGNICVTSATNCSSGVDSDNYIIRLHPAYLINGKAPATSLRSYDHEDVKENVSNILLTIYQKILEVSANGGSKMYGVVDTNYKYYNTSDAVTNSNEELAYLNGYSVTGFVHSETVSTTYSSASIITGTLRRVAGEKVGSYTICNVAGNPTNYTTTSCESNNDEDKWAVQGARTIDVSTSNVYYFNGSDYTQVSSVSNDLSNVYEGHYVKDGSNKYFKITYANFDRTNKKLSVYDDIWKRTYDSNVYDEDNSDDTLAIKVAVNTTNHNQNYVISYTTDQYEINERDLVIQPGINQGKEYSNPAHIDPVWQLVVYGEVESYIVVDGSGFNGYTQNIGLSYSDTTPTCTSDANCYYKGNSGYTDDTTVYFNRRKKTNTSSDYVYNYTYTIAASSGVFTLDGVEYKINSDKVYRNTGVANDLEVYTHTDGVYTIGGLNKFTVSGNTITVTLTGHLVYQNYNLFTNSSKVAGKGTISRISGEDTGWYAFDDNLTNLLIKEDNLTTNGANYTRSYNDNAPTRSEVGGKDVYTTTKVLNTSNIYSPEYSFNADVEKVDQACTSDFYSVPCSGGHLHKDDGDRANNATSRILFEIFKRDIVLSFNYRSDNYGYAYSQYKTWYFDFTSTSASDSSTPKDAKTGNDMITCYAKASLAQMGDASITKYPMNSNNYVKLAGGECANPDHGLSESDNWGTIQAGVRGLGLTFKLALADSTTFNNGSELVYALPAGVHYVHASIQNDNYRLVYIDYYTIRTAENKTENDATNIDGSIDIKPAQVTLTGTDYQKEFGQAIYSKYYNGSAWTNAEGNIFDLHYVGCGSNVGCGYEATSEDAATTALKTLGSKHSKNMYNSYANVYGYTVSANSGYVFAGSTGTGAITDTIYNNFYGVPVRDRYANPVSGDAYGALDGVGRYAIKLTNILPAYATYSKGNNATTSDVTLLGIGIDAAVSNASKIMITRYTNYTITDKTSSGTLYVLPARIEVEVTDGQTKMYGCAYNGGTNNVSSWDRSNGYSDCVESMADYYDFGYKYEVYGDKVYEALASSSAKLTAYNKYSEANTLANYNLATYDLTYNNATTPSYTVEGIVATHNNAIDRNNVVYTKGAGSASTTSVTISNSSLNNGVLYRAPSGGTYTYADYWAYANEAQTKSGGAYGGFQNQSVGSYIITLGNLDSVFNANNHCNNTSDPTSDGANTCKNFIVYKGDNNTSTHTKSGSESISDATLTHAYTTAEFAITQRSVKLHTEYNYKVFRDTDSKEGFTFDQIKEMYTRTTGYNSGKTFSFDGRSYATGKQGTDFINMGVSRYYAVDNSLAKAPWTKWSDGQQGNAGNKNRYFYDDILYDVITYGSLLARTNESGSKSAENNADGTSDKVGKYAYDWTGITVSDTTNYGSQVLTGNSSITYVKTTGSSTINSVGFYNENGSEMARYYSDAKHKEHGTNSSSEYHQFVIDNTLGNYPFSGITKEFGDVYYEIVKREIILVADNVEKVYGIEDAYAMFTVKLCSTYEDTNSDGKRDTCTLIEEAYGNRNTLSKLDYEAFITSQDGNNIVYDQYAIRGYTDSTGYSRFKGTDTNNTLTKVGSFGIFYYRAIGEVVGEYTIKACPTQTGSDGDCSATDGARYEAGTDGTTYNAANYIITSYTGTLTINVRGVDITPDSGQGFQYGNYETGSKIAPITFTETYTELALNNGVNGYHTDNGTKKDGLVNGAIGKTAAGADITDDSLAKQYSLCLFDISGLHKVCINDRQNSTVNSNGASSPLAYTGQYDSTQNGKSYTGGNLVFVNNNVYNDEYNEDRDSSRYALDRVMTGNASQRYNRNVGVYTIVAGELLNNARYDATNRTKNYLNDNYKVNSVTEGVTYEITAANVTVTPNSNQSKIYGQKDVELTFTVETSFVTDELPVDYYYCGANQDACKQKFTKTGSTAYAGGANVSFAGFAYSEDIGEYSTEGHNYGQSKVGNKTNDTYEVGQSAITGTKYFDKYCLTGTAGSYATTFTGMTCNSSDRTLAYTAGTNRILLGYLYVEGWSQDAGESATDNGVYKILNGMIIAYNEHAVPGTKDYKNYILNFELDADTGVTFEIDKLDLDIDIVDITKTYGEATDAYKCEDGNCSTRNDLLTASDHENRLEYNFNVTNVNNSKNGGANVAETGVYTDGSDILLINPINGKYYTQTAAAEYKNTHIGIRVVRESGASGCTVNTDEYGCEDVDTYQLKFVKAVVADNVDYNYNLHIGGTEVTVASDNAALKSAYISVTQGASKDTASSFASTDNFLTTAADFATLTITKRSVTFYIGTYTANELVDGRYTIEQNEMLPNLPQISDTTIGYTGQISTSGATSYAAAATNPYSKQVYYVTWFDNEDVYREVRTSDAIVTTISDKYGVAYCNKSLKTLNKTSVDDVDLATCGSGEMIYSDRANKQENGIYVFDTLRTGEYAILRDPSKTGIVNQTYETKNYTTIDKNGVLVIYEDSTAPEIQIGNSEFTLEANAEVTCTTTGGITTCTIGGKQVSINDDQTSIDTIGNVIKYITQHFSKFAGQNNIVVTAGLKDTVAKDNKTIFESSGYCRMDTDTGCTTVFQPVNNPGLNSANDEYHTTYQYLRTDNDYDWDASVIDSDLRAVTSVISWFNITSYDYSYIRNESYIDKRYVPRYYIYVNGPVIAEPNANDPTTFDPRYVGDFTISIYAIDGIGNVSDEYTVTLHIKDETQPIVGEVRVFNTPVKCTATDKECATDITKWVVDAGSGLYVDINSFIKYSDTSGTIDDLNGTYIYINGGYKSLYGGVVRYTLKDGNYSQSVSGRYVKLTSSDTVPALQVEHRYWSNEEYLYTVVVGGSDNSYVKSTNIDYSQWQHYYKVHESWYLYTRSTKSSVKITTATGVNDIVISAVDSGRKVEGVDKSHTYYENVYLLHADAGNINSLCTSLGCTDISLDKAIESNANIELQSNKFNILGVEYTLSADKSEVTWGTSQQAPIDATARTFTSGIMTCTFSEDYSMISICETDYKAVVKNGQAKTITIKNYTSISEALNMSSLATAGTDDYYRDRKYIYIDTTAATSALNSQGYMIYEFGCIDTTKCSAEYTEHYFNATETTTATKGNLAVTAGTALSSGSVLTKLGTLGTYEVKGYTGEAGKAVTMESTALYSGIPNNSTSHVMDGASAQIAGSSTAYVNYFYTDIDVYLAVRNGADTNTKFYRYTILWNGSAFVVYRVTGTSASGYAYVLTYDASSKLSVNGVTVGKDSIYALLPEIVTKDTDVKADTGTEYHFDVNYTVYDIAGNKAETLVRGITFVSLNSLIDINVDITPSNAGVAMVSEGNNVYTVSVNQGVSLSTLMDSISISNIDKDGVNNISSIKQALYYNGDLLFEGVSYNEDVFDLINDYSATPGTYTLKLTSTRQVNSIKTQGLTHTVEDTPLEINFVVKPAVASVSDTGDYSSNVVIVMSMMMATLFLLGLGYVSLKRRKN